MAQELVKPNIDDEQKLEVQYRVLKDQIIKTKKDLIDVKKCKDGQKLQMIEIKKKLAL